MTALQDVIRLLSEAREAAIDADEQLARDHPHQQTQLMGVTIPLASLAVLIAHLEDAHAEHERYRRTARRIMIASMAASSVALASSLYSLLTSGPP